MQDIELLGVPGSPYTRKMLALLRYRRIPHRMLWGSHFDPPRGYPEPKVKLLPTFYFPTANGLEAMVDSTPIIRRLEAEHSGRTVIPDDPLLCFLDQLIEDFADEWLSKAMFHYRWNFSEDAAHAGPLLALWQHPQLSRHNSERVAADFAHRQISRLFVVGSNKHTAPVIESSFQRMVGIMDRIIERQGFVLGSRPASADFALFGQLTQLGLVDPTPAHFLECNSPRLRAWLDRAEDLSGHTDDKWLTNLAIPDHLGELLQEIGRCYAPFLIANAQAAANGQMDFETTIDNNFWSQPVFPYQVKCLEALRNSRKIMNEETRDALDSLLTGTGCEILFR
ncbi:MAG: glutathione S-transferase [Burkholderiales bacterium 35-55-47]|jgi:glutathione S-transferase|uniref:glutathione S-transferase C-terminal domain-containing protein n=1 Tax=Limnohabitans sp. TaxID=1907725 RepID=UPI000BD45D1E|nr:glutathione S-transferase C-terminal domain-containing protein [Limnohabitans sp.]OYY18819.1 MAG: glutathione S-transferase [Burkholderiales bacterium 35-55-47]OYZ73637.1 MAG: glutathione S-transferase [Burkholderiales bacterium 24-55-52]OZB00783.1 MAG: glutathione S-transferase [Burkholderiales bacterium 39-55-53]HQR85455.1 glutathione S-transferase C-terminal domain-containing protein [Limnohabitans sp.]HQS26628.1 glutathione S-transferase C-terminal domain-containing protein [Limnohabita